MNDIEAIEYPLLLEAIYQRWGYDFRDYAPSFLRRRLKNAMARLGVNTLSALQERLLRDAGAMAEFLDAVSIGVTAMFRDPSFFRAFRDKVVPRLRPLPLIRIWHAACSTGEEVYSMAILLHEEGLLEHARLYATDLNPLLLAQGKEGVMPLKAMSGYKDNYQRAGGKADFSAYYTAGHDGALLHEHLRGNIVWAEHNLAQDQSFNEFHVILCRNVLIYFNHRLQERVHHLLYDSLAVGGVLGLGRDESLPSATREGRYAALDRAERLYYRVH